MRASEVIAAASSWLGYCGKKSAQDLDDFTANTSGKYNKFAAYFDDLFATTNGPLNGRKNGTDWCAIFILYIACHLADSVYAGFDTFCQTWNGKVDNCAAGVAFVWNYFGYYDRQTNDPAVGDVAFIKDKKDGLICHVALVESIDGDSITTIDGNWNGKVQRVVRDRSEFRGFGRPNYEPEPEPEPVPTDVVSVPREEYNRMISQLAEYSVRAEKAEEAQKLAEIELANIKNALKNLL